MRNSDRRCEAPQGGAIIGASDGELSIPTNPNDLGSDPVRSDPGAVSYFFGAAAAATGSAVNVPPASNGFTLIVPSSLVGDAIFAA